MTMSSTPRSSDGNSGHDLTLAPAWVENNQTESEAKAYVGKFVIGGATSPSHRILSLFQVDRVTAVRAESGGAKHGRVPKRRHTPSEGRGPDGRAPTESRWA